MRPAIKITLAVSSLLVISACGSEATPTATATRAAIVPATASATPSVATSTPAPSTPAQASSVVKKRTVTSRRAIPFTTMRVNDSALSKGSTRVRNLGVRGVEILTYKVTLRNGIQTHKELVRKVIVRAPVTRVVAVGTKETQQCDPNYSGACVPIASDVDCTGGSGNGPAYVQGPVQVIGTDIYGLDRDGDGIGCEDG
jgi:resuscitation-promoting factor RpfB